MAAARRQWLAGPLLACTGAGAGLAAFVHPAWILWAGGCAWLAAVLLWSGLAAGVRIMATVLMTIGAAGMAWGLWKGISPNWTGALSGNIPLLGMLIGVSFLQLVALPRRTAMNAPLPAGPGAFRQTSVGVHLFSSVINFSAVPIVGDRLHRERQLDRPQAILLSRSFSTAAFWSPFFASMAAALTFAPDARFGYLLMTGLPLAAIALAGTWWGTGRHVDDGFQGYPVHYTTLRVPAILAIGLLSLHSLMPELSVIGIITVLSPAITMATLLPERRAGARILYSHITSNLPRMGNEALLFLSAGVMAAGLYSIIAGMDGWSPYTGFGAIEAWMTTVAITALAVLGVHPVISIAAFGTLIIPLAPNHDLLAMSFLIAWGLGATAGPLSGLNLTIQGRYGINGLSILRWNWRYVIGMLIAGAPALWLMEWLVTPRQ